MSKRKLNLVLFLISINIKIVAQYSFNTELTLDILPEDYSYYQETKDQLYSSTELVKNDITRIQSSKNTLWDFVFYTSSKYELDLYSPIDETKLSKDEIKNLWVKQKFESHWSSDTITVFYVFEKFKLAQEWVFDTLGQCIAITTNKIQPLIKIDSNLMILTTLKSTNNNLNKLDAVINNSTIPYVEERTNYIPLQKSIINELLQFVSKQKLPAEQIDQKDDFKISSGKIILNGMEILHKENKIKNIEGIRVTQLLYIDIEANAIYTKLIDIGFYYPLFDEDGDFKYNECLYKFKMY